MNFEKYFEKLQKKGCNDNDLKDLYNFCKDYPTMVVNSAHEILKDTEMTEYLPTNYLLGVKVKYKYFRWTMLELFWIEERLIEQLKIIDINITHSSFEPKRNSFDTNLVMGSKRMSQMTGLRALPSCPKIPWKYYDGKYWFLLPRVKLSIKAQEELKKENDKKKSDKLKKNNCECISCRIGYLSEDQKILKDEVKILKEKLNEISTRRII